MAITTTIAENLAAWMARSAELNTLKKLAARSGVGFGTVRRMKNGDGNPTIKNITDVARAFGKRPEDLLLPGDGISHGTVRRLAEPPPPPYLHGNPLVREVIAIMDATDEAGKGMVVMAANQALEKYRPIKQTAA